jgi:hypothetical protein
MEEKVNGFMKGIDKDVWEFSKFVASSNNTSSWEVIKKYLVSNPQFLNDFYLWLAMPKSKPLMVEMWEKRGDKNEGKQKR